MSPTNPIVVCFSANGTKIGKKLVKQFGGKLLTKSLSPNQTIPDQLQSAFLGQVPIIGICASGILIRILAPLLADKIQEPPVVCISDDGQFVIPLLGGHNGANRLAEEISSLLKSQAVFTTGSYTSFGLSLVEPPDDWKLDNPDHSKSVASAILNGRRVVIEGYSKWIKPLSHFPNVTFQSQDIATNKIAIIAEGSPSLNYFQKNIAMGIGCVRGCSTSELLNLIESKLVEIDISLNNIEGIYSVDIKCDEHAIHQVARKLNLPVRFFSAKTLEKLRPRLKNPSEVVYREIGCHGVCEAACLARAGEDGRLILPKSKTQNATIALAHIGTYRTLPGTPRGRLSVVGIGPGKITMRSPEVTQALTLADEVVGYRGYLDQLEAIPSHSALVPFELGEEEQRCRYALEAAGKGKQVVLVCSGDSSIYAMNSLVLELIEIPQDQGGVSELAKKIELRFLPGISAFQAASAKAGGLIGHDFCAISLSNLLTDTDTILRRVKAAAQGDFVIAFYNPASKKRKWLFEEAIELIRIHRYSHTPVLIAKAVSRPNENITIRSLSEVQVNDIDMFTIVIIGNSQSRMFWSGSMLNGINGYWGYSPRGYDQKRNNIIKERETE